MCCQTPISMSIDRKSTRLNSSHLVISYAVFCLKKKKKQTQVRTTAAVHSVYCSDSEHCTESHDRTSQMRQQMAQREAEKPIVFLFFFFNDTATTEIYTLSLHDALPI